MKKIFLTFILALLCAQSALAQTGVRPSGFVQDNSVPGNGDALYVTLANDASLTHNRILSPTARFVITDNGAKGNYVLELATVPIAYGGTGQVTAQLGFNALADGIAGAAAASGDVLYRGATNWTRLPKGSDGQFLSLSGGIPTWAAGSGGVSSNLTFITGVTEASAPNSSVLTAGTGITVSTVAGAAATVAIDSTVVTKTGTQTLTNKTITAPIINAAQTTGYLLSGSSFTDTIKITDPGQALTLTIPDTAINSSFVMTESNQTVNGVKTFGSAPKLSTNTITSSTGNTITFPNAADTVVNLASTQTLTNKTLTSPSFGTSFILAGANAYTNTWTAPSGAVTINYPDPGATVDHVYKTSGAAATAGGVAYGTGSSTENFSAAGSTGQPLLSGASGAPTWGTLGNAYGGTNQTTYATGDILYASAANTLSKLAIGSSTQVLTVTGGVPVWAAAAGGGGGVTSFTGDSALLSNSASTGAVTATLANAAANTVWGNATNGSAAPGYTTNPSVTSVYLTNNKILFLPDGDASSIALGLSSAASQTNASTGNNVAIGKNALNANASGTDNVAIGLNALKNNASTSQCVAIGSGAGGGTLGANAGTVAIGYNALASTAGALDNTAIGYQALSLSATTGGHCTAVGYDALQNATGANNTAVGDLCGTTIAGGTNNTAVGSTALNLMAANSNATAIGYKALAVNTAANNTAVGSNALLANTSAVQNTAVGFNALSTTATAGHNTAVGYQALKVTTGLNNVALGDNALTALTSGANNTALGSNTLTADAIGDCTAVGMNALKVGTAQYTTAVGSNALAVMTSGAENTAVGGYALSLLVSGTGDTALGYQSLWQYTGNFSTGLGDNALQNSLSGDSNTAVGHQALTTVSTAASNTAVGKDALKLATGANGTAIGKSAGAKVSTGTDNICIGLSSGATTLQTGSSNILIGSSADTPANNTSNYINIGPTVMIRGSADITTVNGSTSGTYKWSMPERGASYKTVIVTFQNCTDAGGTITFPTAFTNTPDVFDGAGVAGLAATVSTTTYTVPATAAKTGTVMIVGF